MSIFDEATIEFGQAGLPGTGITSAEKTTITSDLSALKGAGYIVRTASTTLTNETVLSTLATGLVKVTTGTGVLTTAVAADLPVHTHVISGNINIPIIETPSVITPGVKLDLRLEHAITITAWNIFADQAGAMQIDLWRDTYGNYPPTDADSITGTAPIVLPAGNNKWGGNPLTGWDTTLDAYDNIRVNVDSCTSVTRATIVLAYTRTI